MIKIPTNILSAYSEDFQLHSCEDPPYSSHQDEIVVRSTQLRSFTLCDRSTRRRSSARTQGLFIGEARLDAFSLNDQPTRSGGGKLAEGATHPRGKFTGVEPITLMSYFPQPAHLLMSHPPQKDFFTKSSIKTKVLDLPVFLECVRTATLVVKLKRLMIWDSVLLKGKEHIPLAIFDTLPSDREKLI